jgi:hypothetical protein
MSTVDVNICYLFVDAALLALASNFNIFNQITGTSAMRMCYTCNMNADATEAALTWPGRNRTRRHPVRVLVLDPQNPTPPRRDGRRNPHGWRFANEARRRNAQKKAMRMLLLRLSKCRADTIAEMFGTTRAAVYQRLYRMRRGNYDKR